MRGNQPAGQMNFYKRRERLPGYNGKISLKCLAIKRVTNNQDLLVEGLYHAYKCTFIPNIIHKNDLKTNQKA